MVWQTAEELDLELAKRLRVVRKRRKITQQQLALRSNVSYGSIKRFESTGEISLVSLTRLCIALNCENDLRNLFTDLQYSSIDEVINERI